MRRELCIAAMLFVAASAHGFGASEDVEKGLALRGEGKNRLAVEAFDRALATDPRDVQTLVQKGASLEDQGRWKQAAAMYRQALAIEPDNTFARRNLEQLLSSRMVAGPRSAYNPAGEALLHNGLLALQLRDFSRAQDTFRLASGLMADDPRPLFFGALTLEEQGKDEEAGELYRKTVAAFPEYVPARIHLILRLFASGRAAEAQREAQKALAAFPERTELRSLLRLVGSEPGGRGEKHAAPRMTGAP